MSDILRRYAEARWNDDGGESDLAAVRIAEPGPNRTQLRIVAKQPRRLPLTWRESDFWPVCESDGGGAR